MRDDLKAAFRSLRSSKTFTAVALIVLVLGVGASTAIFSLVDAVVLRGLPFDEHDRLVAVGERRTPGPRHRPSATRTSSDPSRRRTTWTGPRNNRSSSRWRPSPRGT